MHPRVLASAATTLLMMGACTSAADTAANQLAADPSTPNTTGSAASQEIRVTRDADRGPQVCRPQQVGETVTQFFGAINDGAVDTASFFAPDMEWYSISEWSRQSGKRHFVSYGYQPEELESYFGRRIIQHEQLHLLEIDVYYERQRNLGHVAYALQRTADDLDDADPIVVGKGAIDCHTGRIAVWSMSHDARFQKAPALCPGEAEPPRIAIACARA